MNWIKKYKGWSLEDKTIFATKISICLHCILAITKSLFAVWNGVFFFIAGCMNVFLMLAKTECYFGIKKNNRSFKFRNRMVALFLLCASLVYIIYMARLVCFSVPVRKYSPFLAINIAFISFVELGIAIRGLFIISKKGHYYRNIKIINFCSALTAIVLTQVAILSFSSEANHNFVNGMVGIGVGIVILILAVYIYFAPKTSIIDREHNVYRCLQSYPTIEIKDNIFELVLVKSFWYGNYIYRAEYDSGILNGHIYKTSGGFKKLPVIVKIICIILSEILIFVYAGGALIYYFRTIRIIDKLDLYLKNNHFEKIEEGQMEFN